MGHRYVTCVGNGRQRWRWASRRSFTRTAFATGICAVTVVAFHDTAVAGSNITTGSTSLASNLGGSVNPDFDGGTLELDSSTTISKDFTVEDVSTNTIDIYGKTVTMSGAFTGAGPMTFADSVGGGNLTLTSSDNDYTGATTINSGATLSLSDSGIISSSSNLTNNGTFDISATTSGASVVSLRGSGSVRLGAETLSLSDASGTFSGTISGTGGFMLSSGTETLSGANTYTGLTTITEGTLTLSGKGSVATSSGVNANGTFDISAVSGVSIKSLSGSGTVELGAQTLTLTDAHGTFSGLIEGSGGLTLNGGTEILTGVNSFTGPVTINGGTLDIGSNTIAYNISNNGTFGFYGSSTIVMSGVISGPGAVTQSGGASTTITTPQTYTGPTTITSGRLTLSGNGSIATSSSVTATGTLDISGAPGASIMSLSGDGYVYLGDENLTLTDAADDFAGTIYGTGGLILKGGTETLSGSNSYTGITTVTSGTLIFSAGTSQSSVRVVDDAAIGISPSSLTNSTSASIVSLSGHGTVALGAYTLILTNANDTFSGAISGTSGLTISGGTETLSGANTYTGTTTISAGALVLSATGSLAATSSVTDSGAFDVSATPGASITFASLSGSGVMTLGAKNLNLSGASGTFSGSIQGTGGLTVSGGTEILAGTNGYTGGTTISAGTLQLGTDSSGGSILGDVLDNGTLSFFRSDTNVFSGTISGTGSVVQFGSGTTILTAANTYAGGTTITAGTLQIGNDGTSGSILGDVTDNGTLAFGRSDTTNFSGVISGTGGLTQLSGTTVLTAVNTYTGATTINRAADLVLSGAGSIAASKDITDNGTFDVSAVTTAPQISSLAGTGAVMLGSQSLTLTSASGTFSGVISGAGGVTIGGGTETFSGTNTYSGITTIKGGTLAVNGSIASSRGVTVNSGGTLAGSGTVSAVTVDKGGTLAPGVADTGTLNAKGAVTFASGSNFVVNFSSASATKLTTSGTASLAGTLTTVSTDGTYPLGQKLTVLTASGGVTGGFTLAQITSTGATFSSALSYDADNVYLEIDLAKLSPLLPSGASANQVNVVGGIDAAIAAGKTLPQEFENFGNVSSATLATDATQLAGEIGSDIPQVGNALLTPFFDAIFDHISDGHANGPALANNPQQQRAEIWMSGFDGAGLIAGTPDTTGGHSFKSNVAGFVGGANWTLSPKFMLGAAVSAGFANFHLVDDLGTGKANAIQAGLYGLVQFSPHFYGSFAGAFALNRVTTDRVLTVSGTDDLTGKLTSVIIGGRYEAGVSLGWATPYIALQDEFSMLPAYSETASSGASTFALHYAARSVNVGGTELGVRQGMDFDFTPRWVLTPDGTVHLSGRVAWAHNFFAESGASAAFVALPSSDFTVYHAKAGRDSALVSLGSEIKFDGGFRLSAHIDSAISSKSQTYTGMGGIGYTW